MKKQTNFDVLIIGGSSAGLSADMSLGRALRNVLIIDSGLPCNKKHHTHITSLRRMEKKTALLQQRAKHNY